MIPALRYLKSRRHEIYVVHVMDRAEREPQIRGDLRLVDSEDGAFRDVTVTDAMRAKFTEAFDAHSKRVETHCRGAEMGYVQAWTDVPFDQLVLHILKRGGLVA